jgi:uncharacterized protein with FMN-binding domain
VNRRRANGLVALSSAAVMAVYTAGYMKTRAAAAKLEATTRVRPVQALPPSVPALTPSVQALTPSVPEPSATVPERPSKVPEPSPTVPKRPSKVPAPSAKVAERPSKVPEPSPKVAEPSPKTVEPPVQEVEPPAKAPEPPPPANASPRAELLLGFELHDGTYLGWGSSRHGDIQASVTVENGRITATSIAQCRTRYSCDIIAHLPAQVVKFQTPEKVSYVSGATQSVDAFYWAVMDALSKAK